MNFDLTSRFELPVSQQKFEYVERKGLGHPDTICDSVMESAAQKLRAEYQARCGRILHHNLDKALLVAGSSQPQFGGGKTTAPIQIYAGDRATNLFQGKTIPVDEIVEAAVLDWFRSNLRFVATEHIQFHSRLRPGSADLTSIFERRLPVANDTSAAIGYAPWTETERLVFQAEQFINSPDFKQRFPVAGEDVKVMGIRHDRHLNMTVAIAFVDQFVASGDDYFEQKKAIQEIVREHLRARLQNLDDVSVDINALDDPSLGLAGMYLTVTGTSAESGDGGQVGRGNSVNGLISLNRPTSNEAAAGKNNVCHVGNIYNHLSHRLASQIVADVEGVDEAYVWLCSQIGKPVDEPWAASVAVSLSPGATLADVRDPIGRIMDSNFEQLRSTGRIDPITTTAGTHPE